MENFRKDRGYSPDHQGEINIEESNELEETQRNIEKDIKFCSTLKPREHMTSILDQSLDEMIVKIKQNEEYDEIYKKEWES